MPIVVQIKAQPMTAEAFSPYGELMEARERPSENRQFFPVGFESDGQTTISAIWQPKQGTRFTQLERHFGVTQSFVQIEGGTAAVAVALPTGPDDLDAYPRPEDVKAFLIDPTKGFMFRRGTWHSLNRYIFDSTGATFVILNSRPNPTQIVDYEKGCWYNYTDLGTDKSPRTESTQGIESTVLEIIL
jgi:ureidoglycolate lyase